jgi:hypothetical protein
MRQINLRVTDEMLTLIDEARGDVPRERWIRAAVVARLGGGSVVRRAVEQESLPRDPDHPLWTAPRPQRLHAPNCKCPVCS